MILNQGPNTQNGYSINKSRGDILNLFHNLCQISRSLLQSAKTNLIPIFEIHGELLLTHASDLVLNLLGKKSLINDCSIINKLPNSLSYDN